MPSCWGGLLIAAFQICAVWSPDAVTTSSPPVPGTADGWKRMEFTEPLWPTYCNKQVAEPTHHMRAVWSEKGENIFKEGTIMSSWVSFASRKEASGVCVGMYGLTLILSPLRVHRWQFWSFYRTWCGHIWVNAHTIRPQGLLNGDWDAYDCTHVGYISLLLPRLSKLPGPFEEHWLGNLRNLGSSKEIQFESLLTCWCSPDDLWIDLWTIHLPHSITVTSEFPGELESRRSSTETGHDLVGGCLIGELQLLRDLTTSCNSGITD